jgi:hypothetical protein
MFEPSLCQLLISFRFKIEEASLDFFAPAASRPKRPNSSAAVMLKIVNNLIVWNSETCEWNFYFKFFMEMDADKNLKHCLRARAADFQTVYCDARNLEESSREQAPGKQKSPRTVRRAA